MISQIKDNPFRVLGVFANATLKQIVATRAQLKSYASVGQEVDNPLRLPHLVGKPANNEAALMQAESQITLPKEKALHASFWFLQGNNPEADLKAVSLIDEGKGMEAIKLWEADGSAEANHNAIVAAMLLGAWKVAVRNAIVAYRREHDIRLFLDTILGIDGHPAMGDIFLWCEGNVLWTSILNERHKVSNQKNIDKWRNRIYAFISSDETTNGDELLAVCNEALAPLGRVLGQDNAEYQMLAMQLVDAIDAKLKRPFATNIELKITLAWKGYQIATDPATKARMKELAEGFEKNKDTNVNGSTTSSGISKAGSCLADVLGYLFMMLLYIGLSKACGWGEKKESKYKYKYHYDIDKYKHIDPYREKAIREEINRELIRYELRQQGIYLSDTLYPARIAPQTPTENGQPATTQP